MLRIKKATYSFFRTQLNLFIKCVASSRSNLRLRPPFFPELSRLSRLTRLFHHNEIAVIRNLSRLIHLNLGPNRWPQVTLISCIQRRQFSCESQSPPDFFNISIWWNLMETEGTWWNTPSNSLLQAPLLQHTPCWGIFFSILSLSFEFWVLIYSSV